MLTRDQRYVSGFAFEGLSEPDVVVFVLGGDHDVGVGTDRRLAEIEVFGDHSVGLRERGLVRAGIIHRDAKAKQMSQRG